MSDKYCKALYTVSLKGVDYKSIYSLRHSRVYGGTQESDPIFKMRNRSQFDCPLTMAHTTQVTPSFCCDRQTTGIPTGIYEAMNAGYLLSVHSASSRMHPLKHTVSSLGHFNMQSVKIAAQRSLQTWFNSKTLKISFAQSDRNGNFRF